MFSFVRTALAPTRLTGPIFTKELRVTSRRFRHYLLRFGYLVALSLFVVLVWFAVMKWQLEGTGPARIQKMAEAGKTIVACVIWFQFLMAQLVAVILMSNAISGEIRHGTFTTLMTTPISNLQIVVGKLLGGLCQLLLLLAVSLPLLAVVRVFGGVPWSFVVASLCVTLTAAAFAGAVAMFFSTLFRRAYASILLSLGVGSVFYAVLPYMLMMLLVPVAFAGGELYFMLLACSSPLLILGWMTGELFNPTSMRMMPLFWATHCLVMLGLSAGVLALCVVLLRRVARKRAFGPASAAPDQPTLRPPLLPPAPALTTAEAVGLSRVPEAGSEGTIPSVAVLSAAAPPARPPSLLPAPEPRTRRIRGSAILWREIRSKLFPGPTARIIVGVLSLLLVISTYCICAVSGLVKYAGCHVAYAFVYVGIGAIATAVLAATSITTEKESRCWPILLTTPLSDWHILYAKAAGVLRRAAPVWMFLAGHLLVFTAAICLHPIAILHTAMLMAWLIVFLTGTGMYFSARFKRTTTAVVTNIGLVLAIWVVLPVFTGLGSAAGGLARDVDWVVASVNPFAQAIVIMSGGGGMASAIKRLGSLEYGWPDGGSSDAAGTTLRMLACMAAYMAAGVLFGWRARKALRRNIF